MNSDEALAVYLFLQHRPPGGKSDQEKIAFATAWRTICGMAKATINRMPSAGDQ